MGLIGINPARPRERGLSSLEKIALGVDIASKTLGLGLAVPEYLAKRQAAKADQAANELVKLKTGLEIKKLDDEMKPTTEQDKAWFLSKGVPPSMIPQTRGEAAGAFKLISDMERQTNESEFRKETLANQARTLERMDRETAYKTYYRSPAEEEAAKTEVKDFVGLRKTLPEMESRLNDIDRALNLVDRVRTGPLSGSNFVLAARRVLPGGGDVQLLENLLNKEGMSRVVETASKAGARSMDSDKEREYLQKSMAGMQQNSEVVKSILLTQKALIQKSKDEIEAKTKWLEQHPDLLGYRSPQMSKRTYYNEATGEIRMFDLNLESPPPGWIPLSGRLLRNRDVRNVKEMSDEQIKQYMRERMSE